MTVTASDPRAIAARRAARANSNPRQLLIVAEPLNDVVHHDIHEGVPLRIAPRMKATSAAARGGKGDRRADQEAAGHEGADQLPAVDEDREPPSRGQGARAPGRVEEADTRLGEPEQVEGDDDGEDVDRALDEDDQREGSAQDTQLRIEDEDGNPIAARDQPPARRRRRNGPGVGRSASSVTP